MILVNGRPNQKQSISEHHNNLLKKTETSKLDEKINKNYPHKLLDSPKQYNYIYLKHSDKQFTNFKFLIASLFCYLAGLYLLIHYIQSFSLASILTINLFLLIMLFLIGSFAFPYGRGYLAVDNYGIEFIPREPIFALIAPYKKRYNLQKDLTITYIKINQGFIFKQKGRFSGDLSILGVDKEIQQEIIKLLKRLASNKNIIFQIDK